MFMFMFRWYRWYNLFFWIFMVALLVKTCTFHRNFAAGFTAPTFVQRISSRTTTTYLAVRRKKMSTWSALKATNHGNDNQDNKIFKDDEKNRKVKKMKTVHTVTVCVVPPPENIESWKILQKFRTELKDPGFYRWPPHINLLYPFLQLNHTARERNNEDTSDDPNASNSVSDIVEQLESVTCQFEPFEITLDRLGTFGGKRRGVLWLKPSGSTRDRIDTNNNNNNNDRDESGKEQSPKPQLEELQQHLENSFPSCQDQSKKGGQFVPHMTLSHFECLDDAQKAQVILEESYPSIVASDRQVGTSTANNSEVATGMNENARHCHVPISFLLDRIYLLERRGDNGQFLRVAQIALGNNKKDDSTHSQHNNHNTVQTEIFDPPSAFEEMPTTEDNWVYEERMKLKQRRRNNGRKSKRKPPLATESEKEHAKTT